MQPSDQVRFAKWLQKEDPRFFGYVIAHMPEPERVSGLGDISTFFTSVQTGAADFAKTATNLASTFYKYKAQQQAVKLAARQAQASQPITAPAPPVAVVSTASMPAQIMTKQGRDIARDVDRYWPLITAGSLLAIVLALISRQGKTAARRIGRRKG